LIGRPAGAAITARLPRRFDERDRRLSLPALSAKSETVEGFRRLAASGKTAQRVIDHDRRAIDAIHNMIMRDAGMIATQ
jgi:hypothetical protein